MFDSLRLGLLPVFGLLLAGCLLISPRSAHARFPEGANKWAEIDVTNAINRAIDESNPGADLREKLVRRFSECSLMYGGLSTLTSNAEAKKDYVQAQLATMEIELTVAKPLQSEKRLEIEEIRSKISGNDVACPEGRKTTTRKWVRFSRAANRLNNERNQQCRAGDFTPVVRRENASRCGREIGVDVTVIEKSGGVACAYGFSRNAFTHSRSRAGCSSIIQ